MQGVPENARGMAVSRGAKRGASTRSAASRRTAADAEPILDRLAAEPLEPVIPIWTNSFATTSCA